MIADPAALGDLVSPGPRYALDACALAFGTSRGPVLLVSAVPAWERALRRRMGDRLFTVDDPARPTSQAWVGAAWLEPQRDSWQMSLDQIRHELPQGGLLAVVLSLPLAALQTPARPNALGIMPAGIVRLRSALHSHNFKVERTFGFQTILWFVLRELAGRVARRRPDWGDRIHFAMRRSFATWGLALAATTTGLIEARARMRP